MSTPDHRFPCETCGSDMRFEPERGRMICDHCGNIEELEGVAEKPAIVEMDLDGALDPGGAEMEVTRVSSCPNCGAEIEFDPEIHATECPFCATPVVTETGEHRHIKPQGLVPFALDEPAARKAMTDWLGSLWFAPNGLTAYARKGRRLNGIYVPYWTFDARTESRYRGQRGDYYWETRRGSDGKMQRVRRVRWRGASGRVRRAFDDVLVLASRSLPKSFTDALAPWALSDLRPYDPAYLAGFRAEGYQVELPDGFTEGRAIMDAQILRDVKFDIGGDRQRVSDVQTKIWDVTFKHVLLPVWTAAYKYRGQSYRFVINGQTGRVQGERPYSAWKIALAVIAGLIAAGIAGYFWAEYGQ